MRPLLIIIAFAVCAVGCSVSLTLPSPAPAIRCKQTSDCPAKLTCSAELSLCIQRDADVVAPALVPPITVSPSIAGIADPLRVAFAATEALANPPTVSLRFSDGTTQALPGGQQADGTYEFTLPANTASRELVADVVIDLLDSGGNRASSVVPNAVRFDLTAPALSEIADAINELRLAPAPSSLSREVSALGIQGSAVFAVGVSETLLESSVVRWQTSGVELPIARRFGLVYEFDYTENGALGAVENQETVILHAVDLAGNSASLRLPDLAIDTVPPLGPAVNNPGSILFTRAPRGDETTGTGYSSIEGAAGSAEAGCTVSVFTDPGGSAQKHIPTAIDGSIPRTTLPVFFGVALWLLVTDRAGNSSDLVATRDGTFVMPTRQSNGALRVGLARTDTGERLAQGWRELESEEAASLDAVDGVNVSVRAATRWEQRLNNDETPRTTLFAGAFDTHLGRYFQFGGTQSSAGPYSQRMSMFDGLSWHTVSLNGQAPSARIGASMVYDSWRKQLVIFGGASVNVNGYISPGPVSNETFLVRDGRYIKVPAPPDLVGRMHASMAFDSKRGVTVLAFGCSDETDCHHSLLNDVWEFDGSTWREVAPSTRAPARAAAGVTFDARREEVVFTAGCGALNEADSEMVSYALTLMLRGLCVPRLNDVLTWNGARFDTSLPALSQRAFHMMTYDPVLEASIFAGGLFYTSGPANLGLTAHVFALGPDNAWGFVGSPSNSGGFPLSHAAGAVYFDSTRRALSMSMGLRELGSMTPWASVARTEGSHVLRLIRQLDAVVPVARANANLVMTPSGLHVFGGTVGTETQSLNYQTSAHLLLDGGWVEATTTRPFAFGAAYYSGTSIVQAFGRTTGDGLTATTISVPDFASSAVLCDASAAPPAPPCAYNPELTSSSFHAASRMAFTTDTNTNRLVLFGGDIASPLSAPFGIDEVWTYDAAENQWRTIQPTATPGPRIGSAMGYLSARNRAYVFSGLGSGISRDTWELDLAAMPQATFRSVCDAPSCTGPLGRVDAELNEEPNTARVILFGGGGFNDVWAFDGVAWRELEVDSSTPPTDGVSTIDTTTGKLHAYQRNDLLEFEHWQLQVDGRERPLLTLQALTELSDVGRAAITEIELNARAGAVGYTKDITLGADDDLIGEPMYGAELRVFDPWTGQWDFVAQHDSDVSAPSVLTHTLQGTALNRYLERSDGSLLWSIVSRQPTTNGPEAANVVLDHALVTLRYRLNP